MKRILATSLLALLVGCAAPVSTVTSYSSDQPGQTARRSDASELRTKLNGLYEQRKLASLQAEMDRLDKEIAELKARLDALEAAIAEAETRQVTTPAVAPSGSGYRAGSGPVYTGPRGGQYTITPSGNKSYIRRK